MATIREGTAPVLLVVDVQVGVMRDAWDAPRVIRNVSRAVERARAENVPVVWVQHSSEDLPPGSEPWQWVPELVPARGEPLVHKHFNSSFEQTTLDGAGAARCDAPRAGRSRNELVHPCHRIRRAGPRLRRDARRGCAHHRNDGARRRRDDRGGHGRAGAQCGDGVAVVPGAQKRGRHSGTGRLCPTWRADKMSEQRSLITRRRSVV